ncbi:uncharacterized protein M6B38_269665 [Iris pallida]|uniref:RNI-like superfamily protein n=1 Tax=Iris pallida TaxID=29817 RepID=A0AAX6I872_IRIPA|nr:uncharacterized protein M6B38_269665 [Iris pallida]
MEKKKSSAGSDLASTLKNLNLNSSSSSSSPSNILSASILPLRKKKPRRLVSLCLGLLGEHFEDITADLTEIAAEFPPDLKLAMLAIARRRQLLNDDVLIALADNSWELLDVSGSDVSDLGLAKVAELCTNLRAVDISRCDRLTAAGVSSLLSHCRLLEILRCGGSSRSDFTARGCLNILKPELNDVEEESWEELDSMDIVNGAPSLRWLVWPRIDEDSKTSLATECPRIIVNPQPSVTGFRGFKVPAEAYASRALDHSIVEDLDPKTWAVSGAARRATVQFVPSNDVQELPMAERFRLAFLERDTRLAPKRAKNARQNKRRAERDWLMSSSDAKSVVLASQASKIVHKYSR